ncbi:hypothetical protein AgCh_003579 [Apium graveolens]
MFQSNLPIKYWGECVLTSTYLINSFPSKILDGASPYELLFNKLPTYDDLKPFGCLAYVCIPVKYRDKFSTRVVKPPSYLQDYIHTAGHATCTPSFCSCTVTFLCPQPSHHENLVPICCAATTVFNPIPEPTTYEEASRYPEWQQAIAAEFYALEANNTWSLVHLPPGNKAISCKWVFKIKHHADGSIERYKARLLVKGFTQKAGIDYTETFSPVVKMTTIRSLVAIVVKKGWHIISQLEVNNAFLHGDLHEDVYMKPPSGLHLSDSSLVCKLIKSLYGLKQASREWLKKLSAELHSMGYNYSRNDHSLFYKKNGSLILFLAVYVDDILVIGNDTAEITSIKQYLDSVFKIKDLGDLHYLLGLEFQKVPEGVVLSQQIFTQDLIAEFNCLQESPVVSPLDLNVMLLHDKGTPLPDPSLYRKLVGQLNYLTHTRPDLSFCVQHLSQFMDFPRQPHWDAAIHVLKYLRNAPTQGILFNSSPTYNVEAYYDADWAACHYTRKTAEYRSIRRVTAELAWLSPLFSELEVPNITPIAVKCDNQAAIYIAKNPIYHKRTKYIEIDFHFVREKLGAGLISLSYTPTTQQLDDVFTQRLIGLQHHNIMSKLGLLNSPSNLRGGVEIT